jgi:multidrug efflux system membrane fusion protein
MDSSLPEFKYWPHVITLLLITLAFVGYRFFAFYDTRTDDAYVSANVINMATVVTGPITKIYVRENQAVKKGDKLIEIDPRPYLYAFEKAKADLKIETLRYNNNKLAIEIAIEKLKQHQFILSLKRDYLTRYKKLEKEGFLAEIAFLDVQSKTHEQEAVVVEALQELKIAQQNLDDNNIRAAEAVLKQAGYMNDHTTLVAPTNGYITNFNLRDGQYIKAGEGLFALVDTKQWWIVSRYRETSLRLIKPGDNAKITIDMYPGKTFHGRVLSIGWGINRVASGNLLNSTLPYLQATEDWIKIAQRFPVRISIDDVSHQYPLRIGASAVTKTYR